MTPAENKSIARRLYDEYDRDDRAAFAELIASHAVIHLPGAPAPLDREGFLRVSALFADAFSESETTFEDQIAEGDTVVTRWTWRITHTGAFRAIAPTGKRIAVKGITINRLADGKIVEQWVSFDQLDLLEQLGADASPHTPGAPA